MTAVAQTRRFVAELETGAPIQAGALTVVPLFGGTPAGDYLIAADALAKNELSVTEVGGGTVPELAAQNDAVLPVLLLDGEHLQGAMQDRILVASVLVAARSRTVLPVNCVEQGRWHYEGAAGFDAGDDFAYARLRRRTASVRNAHLHDDSTRTADQMATWDDVAAKTAEAGAPPSLTGDMEHAYASSRPRLVEITQVIGEPGPSQSGVIACVAGRVVAMDCFDRPETLHKVWPRLLNGYAMDALGSEGRPVETATIEAFLEAVRRADATVALGVGLGADVAWRDSAIVGNALVWNDRVVHLAVFANDSNSEGHGHIESPSFRRRLRSER